MIKIGTKINYRNIESSIAELAGYVKPVDAAQGGEQVDLSGDEHERRHPGVQETDPGRHTGRLLTV